jgi:hypothetical protein
MVEPPSHLDNARVLQFTFAFAGSDFGCVHDMDTRQDVLIVALANSQYAGDEQSLYVFACDKDWNVIGDLMFGSLDEAKAQAEMYYETGPVKWHGRP